METALYERTGIPVAYIADDNEHSIYTWNGHAVCYILSDKIYGWNGHHIGWFVDGIIYDIHGLRVGFIKQRCPVATSSEPIKNVKYIKYVKSVRCIPYIRPMLSCNYSRIPFWILSDKMQYCESEQPSCYKD